MKREKNKVVSKVIPHPVLSVSLPFVVSQTPMRRSGAKAGETQDAKQIVSMEMRKVVDVSAWELAEIEASMHSDNGEKANTIVR